MAIRLLIFLVAFAGLTWLEAQAPAPTNIPARDGITIDSLKISLADASASRDNCENYRRKLEDKIVELSTEAQKLKDELAKLQVPTKEEKK